MGKNKAGKIKLPHEGLHNRTEVKIFLEVLGVYAILALALAGAYYLGPQITGFATVTKQLNYTDDVNFAADKDDVFVWTLRNAGKLKSVKIDGVLIGNGSAKVYIEHQGARYLVLDNSKLSEKPSGLFGVTGFAVREKAKDEIKTEIGGALNDEQKELFDLLVANINSTRNNVEIEIEADEGAVSKKASGAITETQNLLIDNLAMSIENSTGVKVKIESEFEEDEESGREDGSDEEEAPINETPTINETLIINETQANETQSENETAINGTIEIEKTIGISLEYGSNEAYDANNDGVETLSGIVDFKVDALTNWNADESKLCTRYEVFSVEDEESDFACYGNSDCCALVGLESSRELWNESLFLGYGSLGSTESNIVFAQALYANYSLNADEPYSDVAYSSWKNLTAEFIEGIEFENVCEESCAFDGNATSYNIVAEVENAELRIRRIGYIIEGKAVNSDPVLLKEIENVSIVKNERFALDLGQYFNDEDGDELSYSYLPMENLTMEFDRNTAYIIPGRDFTGTRLTYIEASDSYGSVVSNTFKIGANEKEIPGLEILGVSISNGIIEAAFRTSGSSNLSITPIGGASFAEMHNDNPSTANSLEALRLRCGSFEIFDKESLIETENAWFALTNGSKFKLSEIIYESAPVASVNAEDYNCSETSYYTARIIDDTKLAQEFRFGNSTVRAAPAEKPGQRLEIRGSEDRAIAALDSSGNLNVLGNLMPLMINKTPEKSFVVYDSGGGANLIITNPDGDMYIKGTLNENQSNLIPEPNSFVLQNESGAVIAYVSNEGSVFLRGSLGENIDLG